MKYKVTLNNRTYEVEVEEGKAMLIDEYEAYAPAVPAPVAAAPVAAAPAAAPAAPAAPAGAALAAGEVVKSPMPGNILKINVSQGQKVNEGDVLIVLEAMKMFWVLSKSFRWNPASPRFSSPTAAGKTSS